LADDDAPPEAAADATPETACAPLPIAENKEVAKVAATRTVATAHITSPCAVSRKNTSCVWVPIHLVRSLPVIYPPNPDDTHCITMSHIAVVMANAFAVTPWPGQGEIDANPRPEPSANSTNETDAATNAPAMMAGQEAADPARADSARGSKVCSISFPD